MKLYKKIFTKPRGRQEKTNRGMKSRGDKYETNNRMAHVSASISVITLNVNGLSRTMKRQRRAEYISKLHGSTICY